MNKKIYYIIIPVLIVIVLGSVIFLNRKKPLKETKGVLVVPTMQDILESDSSWCATFELIWNDLKNEVVKKDIVFSPQEVYAENLNKEEFTEDMISSEYYYKTYGFKTLELKKEIEKAIYEKFHQKSDILDQFDWSEDELDKNLNRYFFYTMLYREFEFLKKFDSLKNDKFKNTENVKYFGIDSNTKDSVGSQIVVLYYTNKNDFAFYINTKSNDEVIFYKNPKGNNFQEIYENMKEKERIYKGSKSFSAIDELKIPYLDFNILREYTELENKPFEMENGLEGEIMKAIQSISFSLNEKGGKIKSEAGTDMQVNSIIPDEKREFYVDDTFAIFLKEKGKDVPYFASKINDITKFQQ